MKTYRIIVLFFVCVFASFSAYAMKAETKNGAIWIESATTAEIENLFKKYKFDDFSKIKTRIPRIFLAHLPSDWADIPDSDDKQRTFIRILLPLVMKANEDTLNERLKVELIYNNYLDNQQLSSDDLGIIEDLAKKYDIFTRLKGDERIPYLFNHLLTKIDTVPPSLLIASAGVYSNWGTSRLALKANSLYLDEVWYDNNGLKPLDDENADYRYKIYSSLGECIASRLLKINSHINYEYLRAGRKMARDMDRTLYGPNMVAALMLDNNLKNIAGLIDYTFSYHRLRNTDYLPTLENIDEFIN